MLREFNSIINDPFMRNSAILVFANKQDMRNCMTTAEVCDALGLVELKEGSSMQGAYTKGWGCTKG